MIATIEPTAADLARDLAADLKLCEAARPPYWTFEDESFPRRAKEGWPAAIRRAVSAEDRAARLAAILDGQPQHFALTQDANGLRVEVEHWACRLIAASLLETLADAPNGVTIAFESPGGGTIDVTVQRPGGKPMARVIEDLREENARLSAAQYDTLRERDEACEEVERLRARLGGLSCS
jgi:hypothetical protein